MMAKTYVQIGAGAGDQDSRAKYRDGFSEVVKKLPLAEISKIILVEPNPVNISALSKCWADYPQASIHQIGIVTKPDSGKVLNFYSATADAPHYQVASFDPAHVLKHYAHLSIDDLTVEPIATQDLVSFIRQFAETDPIELLGLDIEGIDAEVLLDTDFTLLDVNLISFEYLHLGEKTNAVIAHLTRSGYEKIGMGVDHNGFDWLYRKVPSHQFQ